MVVIIHFQHTIPLDKLIIMDRADTEQGISINSYYIANIYTYLIRFMKKGAEYQQDQGKDAGLRVITPWDSNCTPMEGQCK